MPITLSAAACCRHCPYRIPVRGACGHPDHQTLVSAFAERPQTTCPVFRRLGTN